jgi:hypothetical protein
VAATTVTHTYVPDFSTGIATGAAAVTVEQTSGTPPNGAVGILPETGAIIFNDDFDYQTLTAAQGGGWLFLTPNSADNATLMANPPEFLFSGDTSTTGTAPPSSGFLRIVASRPNELFDTGNAAQDQPVLAVRNKALTGDFIVETKISFPTPRLAGEARQHGIFIGEPGFIMGDEVSDVNVGADADYIITGPLHDVSVASTGRFGSGAPA